MLPYAKSPVIKGDTVILGGTQHRPDTLDEPQLDCKHKLPNSRPWRITCGFDLLYSSTHMAHGDDPSHDGTMPAVSYGCRPECHVLHSLCFVVHPLMR